MNLSNLDTSVMWSDLTSFVQIYIAISFDAAGSSLTSSCLVAGTSNRGRQGRRFGGRFGLRFGGRFGGRFKGKI